jgi:Ca2+/Na+ antiporter
MRRPDTAPAVAPSGLVWSRSHPEERSLSGLVTLALLAILLAFIVRRVLQRVGMGMSRDRTIALMVVFVIVALMLWGQQTTGK